MFSVGELVERWGGKEEMGREEMGGGVEDGVDGDREEGIMMSGFGTDYAKNMCMAVALIVFFCADSSLFY